MKQKQLEGDTLHAIKTSVESGIVELGYRIAPIAILFNSLNPARNQKQKLPFAFQRKAFL